MSVIVAEVQKPQPPQIQTLHPPIPPPSNDRRSPREIPIIYRLGEMMRGGAWLVEDEIAMVQFLDGRIGAGSGR